ncbi:hypothetical protein Tco_0923269 [Tanacetum coccineum]|uniref:Uncharacterized protein n=1 Tax=Tanacetum coccineum TaxID=301880 RepID=A0ABQ5D0I1_9ASTR
MFAFRCRLRNLGAPVIGSILVKSFGISGFRNGLGTDHRWDLSGNYLRKIIMLLIVNTSTRRSTTLFGKFKVEFEVPRKATPLRLVIAFISPFGSECITRKSKREDEVGLKETNLTWFEDYSATLV